MDTVDIHIESCAPLDANRKSLFRRLFANAFRPSIRQATVVLVDQGFCSIANFLTGVLVARACSKAEYGLYVLGFTLLMTSIGIQTSLSGTPFTVLSPRLKPGELRLYLGSTLVQHLVVSALASVGFFVAAVVVSGTGRTNGFEDVLFALAVASVFMLLRDFMRYVLLAQLRVWASLLMGLAANVATVGILLLAYRGGWLTAPVAYLILGGCSGLPVLFVLLNERKQIAFATDKLCEHLKQNWKFGKWMLACIASCFFAVQVYPWVLAGIWGTSYAAVYGACLGLLRFLNPLIVGYARYFGPKTAHLAHKGMSNVRGVVRLSVRVLVLPLVAFCICVVIFGSKTLVVVFGSKYQGLHNLLLICAVAVVVSAVSSPISIGLNALKRPDYRFRGVFLGACVSLFVGLPLTFSLGPIGAATGLFLSNLVCGIYWWVKFSKLTTEGKGSIFQEL